MWESEADKYWKEKRKAKTRRENIRIAQYIGVSVLCLLFVFKYASPGSSAALRQGQQETKLEDVTPSDQVLGQCKQTCRTKVIDECNNKCRFALTEYPR